MRANKFFENVRKGFVETTVDNAGDHYGKVAEKAKKKTIKDIEELINILKASGGVNNQDILVAVQVAMGLYADTIEATVKYGMKAGHISLEKGRLMINQTLDSVIKNIERRKR